ncbi:hypothetical protein E3N88_39521 [Mikania micrantha]|uniref:Tudor domain-containing protein n=1 Tax=Mikania micrantha TaxID=192012 RepID=A0A5N6LX06_9ASTR|nr:hypothetical protein E3N88_39521 [Mikania micrantha]
MDYVSPINELEQRLKDAGEQLAFPPSSTKDLLDLLDKTEQLLSFVSQAPSISMQGAIVPSMGALIADELVKHSEIDVRVSVASCLCEVARITAPDPPYKDAIMKEIFQLNVLAFGQLSNVSGQSYNKAIHIIESIAKVKSCLLMLDLECDALVLEMFEKFLSESRVTHPHKVFSDMETIMTLIIKESDKISTELLSLLISHVKKENQIVTPASWKLAEKVLSNCNDTLKSYSETILKLINSNSDDYAEVVTVICQNTNENGHTVTRSRTNSTHKRDLNALGNGRSMKKLKYIDKNQLNGKEPETSISGRPKKNKSSLNQDNHADLAQNSQKDMMRTRFQEKKQLNKINGNIENLGSLYNVVIKKENDIPHKWGQDLVGHRIKVWYYKGAVSSYNPLDDKHKVLYADGDEEVLNLHKETWKMLDEISPDQQEQVAILPAKQPKQKGKRKLESSKKQDNSNSTKRSRPAGSSKNADVVVNADNQKNHLDPTSDISSGLKLTENVADDMEKNVDSNPNDELQGKKLSDSSKITQRLENADNLVCET